MDRPLPPYFLMSAHVGDIRIIWFIVAFANAVSLAPDVMLYAVGATVSGRRSKEIAHWIVGRVRRKSRTSPWTCNSLVLTGVDRLSLPLSLEGSVIAARSNAVRHASRPQPNRSVFRKTGFVGRWPESCLIPERLKNITEILVTLETDEALREL